MERIVAIVPVQCVFLTVEREFTACDPVADSADKCPLIAACRQIPFNAVIAADHIRRLALVVLYPEIGDDAAVVQNPCGCAGSVFQCVCVYRTAARQIAE